MTDNNDGIKIEVGVALKDDPNWADAKALSTALEERINQSVKILVAKGKELTAAKALPKFTITLTDNESHETVIEGYCDGWEFNQQEGEDDCLKIPNILITKAPWVRRGMEDQDHGIPWEELGE